jgi:hypothetical protein
MATDPTEAIRALRRQLAVTTALGHSLGDEPDAQIVKVKQDLDDDIDEDLDPTPKRKALELSHDDDGRSR